MIRSLTTVRRAAVAVVSLLLFAQLAPNIALACEGAAVEAHWYKGGVKLAESGEAGAFNVSTGTGGKEFKIEDKETPQEIACKMEDSGKIWNPVGGGKGNGKITSVTFTKCKSILCAAESELKAKGLPWSMLLVSGKPIKTSIANMELAIFCEKREEVKYTGTVVIPILNGAGVGEAACTESTHTTFMQFAKAPLRSPANKFGELEGEDCIWGAAANEKVTVEEP